MEFYGKSDRTIRRWIKDGAVQSEMIDGCWYIYPEPNKERDDVSQDLQTNIQVGELERLRSENDLLQEQLANRDKEIDRLMNLLELSTEQQGVLLEKLLPRQE